MLWWRKVRLIALGTQIHKDNNDISSSVLNTLELPFQLIDGLLPTLTRIVHLRLKSFSHLAIFQSGCNPLF